MTEREIFLAALRLPDPAERAVFLAGACGENQELRERVEGLLREQPELGSFLERPADGVGDTGGYTPGPAEEAVISAVLRERPGSVLGRYKLVQEIGEGGMGTVWMAQQTEPVRRLVALKVIKPGMHSRQVLARFEAERQALALMDHPHIAKVLDAGATAAGRPYFVMELVKGVPFLQYCDEHRLTPRQRLELFIPVCQAIQHAHQKGIIHRDLKPSNLLVGLYDSRPVPKVIDFGVAKATGPRLTEQSVYTEIGSLIGTLEYMSPEQAQLNNLDIDTRSDIYSLGVILYELLTGAVPLSRKEFAKADLTEMLRMIKETEPPRPSTKLSHSGTLPSIAAQRRMEPKGLTALVRGELDWIVMKALEKDRGRRYETANGFARDIQRYLADEPVEACPPRAIYRLRKFARRNKGRLAVAALVVIFLALLAGAAAWAALQQAAQHAALATDIDRDVAATLDFCRQARLREASALLDHAEALAARGRADADLIATVAQVRKDVDMASRLEQIRLTRAGAIKDERFDWDGAVRRYIEAFRDYGLDLDRLEPEEVGARIEVSAIREHLVAALDDWLAAPSGGGPKASSTAAGVDRNRLLAVLVRADGNPWRRRLRAAIAEGNLNALRELAGAYDSGQTASTAVLLGKALHDLREFGLAVDFLRRAQPEHPGDFWLNLSLGNYLLQRGSADAGEAAAYFRVALALRPNSPGVLTHLGIALWSKGDLPGALAVLDRAIALEPDLGTAHSTRGGVLRTRGDLPAAIAAYQRAAALNPNRAEIYHAMGKALEDDGDLSAAVVAYQKAIALRPRYAQNLWAAFGQARYYILLSQWDKAAAQYAKTDLWGRPATDDSFLCASLFLMRGDRKGYDRRWQYLITHAARPENPAEAYILARICAMTPKGPVDPTQAVQWADRAVANGGHPWQFHVLGLAQYRAGQFDQALQSFTKANVPGWKYSDLNWFGLSLVHHRLGHAGEARECLAKGIRWLEREGPPGPEQPAKLLPHDWLEAHLLRREAEEMLKIKRSP